MSGQKSDWTADAWGGLASTLVAIPSSIAFGVATFAPLGGSSAAVGAVAGIVGATLLGIINPLLGGTRGLISAPCAPAAAVLGALAGQLARTHDGGTTLLLLSLVAGLSGGLQILYGLIGGGKIIKFIPYPVVAGFMSGVAVLIFVKQLPGLLGVSSKVPLLTALGDPGMWKAPSMIVAAATIIGVFVGPRLTKKVPAAILGLLAGALAYGGLAATNPGLRTLVGNGYVVGEVGASFGSLWAGMRDRGLALGGLGTHDLATVVVPALTLSALLSIDTLKTAVIVDAITRSRHDSNRELRAQGIGNAVSAVLGGMPGAGTSGPTLVNVTSGAKTRLSGMLEGVFCLVVFTLFSGAVAWIPLAALAGILTVIAIRMFDTKMFALLKRRSTVLDFVVVAAVIAVAVFVGLIQASAAGFALSVMLFAREHMAASVVRRKSSGAQVFSKQRRIPSEMEVLEREGERTTICEVQGNLFFGTTDQLFTELAKDLEKKDFIVLDLKRVQGVDFTAARLLDQMDIRLEEHGGRLVLAGIPANLPTGKDLRGYLADLGVGKTSGGVEIFDDLDAALEWVEDQILDAALPGRLQRGPPLGLTEIDLFHDLESDTLLQAVSRCLEERSCPAGQKLFARGDDGDELFVIRKGTVRILIPLDGERALHVASFGRGDFFGDMAFLDRGKRSADAVALTPVDLFVLSRKRIDALSHEEPAAGAQLFARLARALSIRLRHTDAEVSALQST